MLQSQNWAANRVAGWSRLASRKAMGVQKRSEHHEMEEQNTLGKPALELDLTRIQLRQGTAIRSNAKGMTDNVEAKRSWSVTSATQAVWRGRRLKSNFTRPPWTTSQVLSHRMTFPIHLHRPTVAIQDVAAVAAQLAAVVWPAVGGEVAILQGEAEEVKARLPARLRQGTKTIRIEQGDHPVASGNRRRASRTTSAANGQGEIQRSPARLGRNPRTVCEAHNRTTQGITTSRKACLAQ